MSSGVKDVGTNIGGGGGGGGVSGVATAGGLTGGPITSTGTISISVTGVSSGTYGSATEVPIIVVNTKGQITSATTATVTSGTGNVVGPASATDNALARFDATTGKIIQNSLVIVDDGGSVAVPGVLTVTGVATAANLSGTNTGNVTIATFGTVPSNDVITVSGQVLTVQPADGTHPGAITSGAQTIGGAKTFASTITATNLSGTNTGDQTITLSGDLSGSGTTGIVGTIATAAVTNAKLANMAQSTIKGRAAGAGTGVPTDLTAAQTRVAINLDQETTVSNADYTILNTDRIVAQIGTMSASRTFTLPAANTLNAGQELIVKDTSNTVTTTNTIVITKAGSDTFDNGASNLVIMNSGGSVRIFSDGTSKWNVTARGPNRQIFVASGTWTKVAGVTLVRVVAIGGGGGGASGRCGAASSGRPGGNGGGGGGYTDRIILATDCSATEAVTVGAGGAGGAARPSTNDGAVGATGGASSFGTTGNENFVYAVGGTGGIGGVNGLSLNLDQVWNGGTSGIAKGGVGGVGGAGGLSSAQPGWGAATAGGGGGGGLTAGNVTGPGANGGAANLIGASSGTAATGGLADQNGTAGSNVITNIPTGGGGGSGGGGSLTTNAGAGGNGGLYGGAGGGGGGALNGTGSSGAGGTAAAGIVVVWSW